MYQGDCREILCELPDESVHCCVTSPPYWGLRDYGTAQWDGGNPECGHWIKGDGTSAGAKQSTNAGSLRVAKDVCPSCGAKRIDAQIGLEKTPEEYVAQLVAVFREVKRVLRKDATLWLNLGDSYAGSGCGWANNPDSKQNTNRHWADREGTIEFSKSKRIERGAGRWGGGNNSAPNLKPKDLCGIPWAVAFALRADGWYLRQDIVWSKPNPMPESVTDRCTKAHEYIFLLSKSATYFYNQEAIKEPLRDASIARLIQDVESQQGSDRVPGKTNGNMKAVRFGGNKYGDDDSEQSRTKSGKEWNPKQAGSGAINGNRSGYFDKDTGEPLCGVTANKKSVWTVTTQPFSEAHFATFPPELIKPCILAGCPSNGIVLDPFFGAGTTGLVSGALNCHCIGIELNQEYLEIAAKRLSQSVFQFSPESETEPELQQSLLGPDEEKKRNL